MHYNNIRYFFTVIRANLRNSAELRSSFLATLFGMMLNNAAFVVILLTFVHVAGAVNGWNMADMLALLGFGSIGFGFVFGIFNGIEQLPRTVASGAFDIVLLSPKNTLLRAATMSFRASAIGDVVFGVLCFAAYPMIAPPGAQQWLLLFILIFLTTVVFFAIKIVIYTVSFFFTDAFNITRALLQLFLNPSLQPGGLFDGAMHFFFTFVIPALLVGNVPAQILRDMTWSTVALFGIGAVAWLGAAILFFYRAIRRYESGNFMTFGA